VVVTEVVVGVVVSVVLGTVVVTGVVDVVVWVVVDVGFDVLQDARANDVTMRQVSTVQIAPLFILTSSICFVLEDFQEIDYNLMFRIFLKYNNHYW
jgi:hypothetical protein